MRLVTSTFQIEIDCDKSSDSYVDDFSEKLFCQILSLACKSAVQIVAGWRFFEGDELFNLGHGLGGSSWRETGLFENSFDANEAHVNEAIRLYKRLTHLKPTIEEKLQIPINRWIKSHTYQNPEDKIIDLAIALESLYLLDRDGKSELAFQLRLRASWFLGKDKVHRKELMKDFSQI